MVSDFTGGLGSDEIASIWIDAKLDLENFTKELNKVQTAKYNIGISVDDSQLTDLNNHLDLKLQHLRQVQSFINNNPITIEVDDRKLTTLNRNLSELEKPHKLSFVADSSGVEKALNDIKKEIQATRLSFQLNVNQSSLQNQIIDATKKAFDSPNLNLKISVKDTQKQGKSFDSYTREVVAAVKNVEKATKDNRPGGIGNAIMSGIGQDVGRIFSSSVQRGIKDVTGFNLGSTTRKLTKSIAAPIKELVFDNEEFQSVINSTAESFQTKLRQAGYRLGDGIVAGLETKSSDVQSILNTVINETFKGVDFKKSFQEFRDEIKITSGELQGGLLNQEVMQRITAPLGQQLTDYRKLALQERAIPLVQQRAEEILNETKKAQVANSGKSVTEETEQLFIATGGYAGARGLSGKRLATELKNQIPENDKAIWVKNEDTDISKEAINAGGADKAKALLTSLVKPNLRGYSKDAVEIAAQALVAIDKNPTITIKILGESGGGFPAEEAKAILNMMGHQNVQTLGVGTPEFIGGFEPGNKIISTDESLGAETSMRYARVGMAIPLPQQQLLGVHGHPYENYRDSGVAELQNFIHGAPEPIPVSEMQQAATAFSSVDTSQMNSREIERLSEQAFAALQQVRRHLLVSTGDTKKEIEEVVKTLQNVYVNNYPDIRDPTYDDIKGAVAKAEEYYTYLIQQPGIEAVNVAKKIDSELAIAQENLQKQFGQLTGTPGEKQKILATKILDVRSKLQDPSLGIKQPTLEIPEIEPPSITEEPVQASITISESVEKAKSIAKAYNEFYAEFKHAITRNVDYAKQQANTILKTSQQAQSDLANLANTLKEQGGSSKEIQSVYSYKSQISQVENKVGNKLAQAGIKLDIKGINVESQNVGANIAKGVAIGIDANIQLVKKATERLSENAIITAEETLEIRSPSRVFQNIGMLVAEGFEKGLGTLSNNEAQIKGNFTNVISSITNSAKGFISGFTSVSTPQLEKIIGVLGNVGQAFFAFQLFQMYSDGFKNFYNEAIQTATKFESIQTKIRFSSGSQSEGDRNAKEITENARTLGIPLQSALEGSAGILAASRETPLEGSGAMKLIKSASQASTVFDLDPEKQSEVFKALEEMIGKGNIQAEQLRVQLGSSLPGAFNIAARAMNVTTQQLDKMLKSGQVLSDDFIPKFTQELAAETQSGIAGSLDTTRSVINRFDNALDEFKQSVGEVLLPMHNFSLELSTNVLGGLKVAAPFIFNTLDALVILLTKPMWMPFIEGMLSTEFSFADLATSATKAMSAIQVGAGIAWKALAPLIIEFGAFELAVGMFKSFQSGFEDLADSIHKSTDSLTKGLKDYNDNLAKMNKTPDARPKSWWDKRMADLKDDPMGTLFGGTGIGGALGIKDKYDERLDKFQAINDSGKVTDSILKRTKDADTVGAVNNVKNIDKQLADIQSQRKALAIQDSPDNEDSLKRLKNQEDELLKKREVAIQPTAQLQKLLAEQVDVVKANIKEVEQLRQDDPNRTDEQDATYTRNLDNLKKELEKVEKAQRDFTKSINTSADAFTNLKKNISDVANALLDTNDKNTILANKAKASLIQNAAAGNITPGTELYQTKLIELRTQQEQLDAQRSAYKQTSGLLNNEDTKTTLKAYNITPDMGAASITALTDKATTDKDKYLLGEVAKLKTQEVSISGLETQLEQSKADLNKQLVDLTKQVGDFYKNIARQAQTQAIEFQKTANEIEVQSNQNKLKEALTGGYDNIITQFVDNLVNQISDLNKITDTKLDEQSKILVTKNSLQDSLTQGYQLQQNIPSDELPKIPVQLDFTGVNNDDNVRRLNDNLSETKNATRDINNEFGEIDGKIDSGVNYSNDLTTGVSNVNNQSLQTSQSIAKVANNINDGVNKADNLNRQFIQSNGQTTQAISNTDKWTGALDGVKNSLSGVQDWFKSILDWLQKAINSTGEWLNGIGSKVQGFMSGGQDTVIQAITDGKAAITGAFDVVSGGKSAQREQDVNEHHGGNAYHEENFEGRTEMFRSDSGVDRLVKDIVLMRNGSNEVPIPSPVQGTARVRSDDPAGYGSHEVEILNPQGEVISRIGHMKSASVKTGDQVSYGQDLGIQGAEGHVTGIHAHIEMPRELWDKYFEDLKKGGFETTQAVCAICGGTNHTTQAHNELGNQIYSSLQSKVKGGSAISSFSGEASWYGDSKSDPLNPSPLTATGEHYDENGLTAASNRLPMNTMVRVTNRANGKSVVVRINDTGNFSNSKYHNRVLDLSKGAAAQLGFLDAGTAQIDGAVLGNAAGDGGIQPGIHNINEATLKSKALPTNVLSNYVESGQNIVAQQSQQQQDLIRKQTEEQLKQQKLDFDRAQARNLETLRKASADLDKQQVTANRQVTDKVYGAIKNPTRDQKNAINSTKIQREYDDLEDDTNTKIEDTQRRIDDAKKALATGLVTNDNKTELEDRRDSDIEYLANLQKNLTKIQETRKIAAEEEQKLFNHEEELRKQSLDFDSRSSEITNLKAKIDLIKQLQTTNPRAAELSQLPALEKLLSLKEADLELDKNSATIKEKVYKKELSPEEAAPQLEALKTQNVQLQQKILLANQQAEQAQAANTAKLLLDQNAEFTNQKIELLKAQAADPNISSKKNPISGKKGTPNEISEDPLQLKYQSDVLQNQEQFNQEVFKISELGRTSGYSVTQVLQLYQGLEKLNNVKLTNLDAELKKALSDEQIQKMKDAIDKRQQSYDVLQKPGVTLNTDIAEQIKSNGGNVFSANAIMRPIARNEENMRYENESAQLDITLADRKNKGIIDSSDDIEKVRSNLEAIHNINLDKVNDQYKTFRDTLTDIAKNGITSLSDGLTGVIMGTETLGKALDNIFNNILSSVLKTGLNSLISGVIPGLFGGNQQATSTSGLGGILGGLLGGATGGATSLLGGLLGGSGTGGAGDNLFSDITSMLGFADGGTVKDKINDERAKSGRQPQIILAHTGELLIPAKRVSQLSKAGLNQKELLGYASGGIVGSSTGEYGSNIIADTNRDRSSSSNITISYKSSVINNQTYVDEDTFKAGIEHAINQGGVKGANLVQNQLVNSPNFRKSVGL